MTKLVAAALAAAFLAVSVAPPAFAQDKKLTPQQEKMRDCAGKWKAEKAAKNLKGRDAHRKFMSECLKG